MPPPKNENGRSHGPAVSSERETGIEPATSSLGSWHSTAELLPLILAVVAGGISNNTGAGTTVQQTFDTITAGRRDFNRARETTRVNGPASQAKDTIRRAFSYDRRQNPTC